MKTMGTGVPSHLGSEERVLLGSYYTPRKYVDLVGEWLKGILGEGDVILDPSCGYGAFFQLAPSFPRARFVGNDIDLGALAQARRDFPLVEFHAFNALSRISRRRYGVGGGEIMAIVGNPPYNDTTSLIGRRLKKSSGCSMDEDVRTRDLGLSSLLAYDKLQADWVAVLHPLRYLIKKANHKTCGRFFGNYRLCRHLVFSSQEFAGTSKAVGFPVLVALYKRSPGEGMPYDEVRKTRFHTVEGDSFCLAEMEFVSDCVNKYPNAIDASPRFSGYYFYTLRDINALRRCRTFLPGKCANAVAIPREKLPYYHYIDCFKHLAEAPYWAGNLDIPFQKKGFPAIADIAAKYSKSLHPEVFGDDLPAPSPGETAALRDYVNAAWKKA